MKKIFLFALIQTAAIGLIFSQWDTEMMSEPRSALQSVSLSGKIYFAGGRHYTEYTDKIDVYSVVSKTWETLSLSVGRNNFAAVAIGSKLFFAGGAYKNVTGDVAVTDVVDIYDTETGTWSVTYLSIARNRLCGVAFENKVYFAGGSTLTQYVNRVDIYNIETDTWTIDSLSVSRDRMACGVLDGKIYFAGGNSSTGGKDIVDIYNAEENTWSVATLSAPRLRISGAVLENRIYFAGGLNDVTETTSDIIDIYDASSNTWSVSYLSVPRQSIGVVSAGDKIFFAGGELEDNLENFADVVDIYDASENTFTIEHLSLPRSLISAVSYAEIAFFAGGLISPAYEATEVIDIYDPSLPPTTYTETISVINPKISAHFTSDGNILISVEQIENSKLEAVLYDIAGRQIASEGFTIRENKKYEFTINNVLAAKSIYLLKCTSHNTNDNTIIQKNIKFFN